MGKVFKSFGLLPFDEVIEVDASKLQTGYVGQAGKLVTETLEQAKGKVLFIDEARERTPLRRVDFCTKRPFDALLLLSALYINMHSPAAHNSLQASLQARSSSLQPALWFGPLAWRATFAADSDGRSRRRTRWTPRRAEGSTCSRR